MALNVADCARKTPGKTEATGSAERAVRMRRRKFTGCHFHQAGTGESANAILCEPAREKEFRRWCSSWMRFTDCFGRDDFAEVYEVPRSKTSFSYWLLSESTTELGLKPHYDNSRVFAKTSLSPNTQAVVAKSCSLSLNNFNE